MMTRPNILHDYTVSESGCWEWEGHIDRNGYGKAYDAEMPRGRRLDWAHRVSYRKSRGPIPEGLDLDHTCENTICVNPDHLEPVTRTEHCRRTMMRLGKDEKHLAAVHLRQRGYTYEQIADALKYAGKGSASFAIESAIQKGLVDAGDVPRADRLTNQDRSDIATLRQVGIPVGEIAAWYGIDESQASRVSRGITSGQVKRGEVA